MGPDCVPQPMLHVLRARGRVWLATSFWRNRRGVRASMQCFVNLNSIVLLLFQLNTSIFVYMCSFEFRFKLFEKLLLTSILQDLFAAILLGDQIDLAHPGRGSRKTILGEL